MRRTLDCRPTIWKQLSRLGSIMACDETKFSSDLSVPTDQRERFQFPTQYTVHCANLEMKGPLILRLASDSYFFLDHFVCPVQVLGAQTAHKLAVNDLEHAARTRFKSMFSIVCGGHALVLISTRLISLYVHLNFCLASLTPLGFSGVESWLHKLVLNVNISISRSF